MTSSAVANSVSGMVRPRALAVLRFMTVSYLVGACTGRSAGFSPLYGALEVKHLFSRILHFFHFLHTSFFVRLGIPTHTCWRPAHAGAVKVGRRSCMGPSKSSTYFHAFSTSFTSFIPVSLFDLESRFFAPTHTCWRPARAGAVKVGRRSGLAARSVVCRPRLDSPEHGGTLVVVGMTRPRGVRCRGTRNSRRNLVSGGSQ